MFIGFIIYLFCLIITGISCLITETLWDERDEKKDKQKEKEISKLKSINRKWFNIDIK